MERICDLPLHLLEENPSQPRSFMDGEKLEELASSISKSGLLHPPLVRKKENGSWQIISGHRRVRAAKKAGLATIAVLVRSCSEQESAKYALIENIQREDLNPCDIAESYQKLIDAYGYTQMQIAEELGTKRSTVANFLRLLSLPASIQKKVKEQTLSLGHAKVILSLSSSKSQELFAQEIVDKGLSVRQAESKSKISKKSSFQKRSGSDLHVQEIALKCEEKFGSEVSIKEQKGKGTIAIKFYSYEDLERLIDLLGLKEEP